MNQLHVVTVGISLLTNYAKHYIRAKIENCCNFFTLICHHGN